jgi:hypothetical protein
MGSKLIVPNVKLRAAPYRKDNREMNDQTEVVTVGDYIRKLQEFPEDWPVQVSTQAGGSISVEHREIKGKSIVAIFGSNGGRFGDNPLTDEEYNKQSNMFFKLQQQGYEYTSVHGDHRLYLRGGMNYTCYGQRFDRRIVERMVAERLISVNSVDIERVRRCSA